MWRLATCRFRARPEGGKVIAGIQLMVDALVGLPQLLLDHALARIARTSRWAKSGQAFRNFAEEVQTARSDLEIFLDRGIARETLRKSNAEVSKDDTGYRGGMPDFRGCG